MGRRKEGPDKIGLRCRLWVPQGCNDAAGVAA